MEVVGVDDAAAPAVRCAALVNGPDGIRARNLGLVAHQHSALDAVIDQPVIEVPIVQPLAGLLSYLGRPADSAALDPHIAVVVDIGAAHFGSSKTARTAAAIPAAQKAGTHIAAPG